MINMEPVLKRGYTAWDRDVLPSDEFEARIERVRAALRAQGLQGLVVVNYSLLGALFDYADIAYLAGLQTGGALLVTLDAPPVLVSFGGGRELAFMRTQTWVRDVLPGSGRPFDIVAEQLDGAGIGHGAVGVVGIGDLPARARARFETALASYELHAFDASLAQLRAVKRPREIATMRIAQAIVAEALGTAVAEFSDGAENVTAMLEAERVARWRKARDVRVLASMSGPELRPFEGRLGGRFTPLRLWVAVQYQGYWASGAAMCPNHPMADQISHAEQAVGAMAAAVRAGVTAGAVAEAGLAELPEPLVAEALDYGLGSTIGLALDEGVAIEPDNATPLIAGSVVALTVNLADDEVPSIAAKTVVVGATGATELESLRVD